jgi:hypothetical protein
MSNLVIVYKAALQVKYIILHLYFFNTGSIILDGFAAE